MTSRFKYSAALLLATAIALTAGADPTSDKTAVIATVNGFFAAMATRSPEDFGRIVLDDGWLHGYMENQDGFTLISRTHQDYVAGLKDGTAKLLERMWDAEVMIHDRLATLWAPYDLYVDGEFSHCGVDAFLLIRTDAGWRISGGAFSMERNACPESPLGAPEAD